MKNIYSNIYKPSLVNLKKAKKNIENNNVIGIPTETVYGLAGNAYSNKSIAKIFRLKKRPSINPLIIHFKNLRDLRNEVILIFDGSSHIIPFWFVAGATCFITWVKELKKY